MNLKKSLASLLAAASFLGGLVASADPPPNTQAPNPLLMARVRCIGAVYSRAPMAFNAPRMQPITEAEFRERFAASGACVGLDAHAMFIIARAQQATLVGGDSASSSAGGLGLPMPSAPPTVAPPPAATGDAGAAVATVAADVPGVTVVPPVTFVMAPTTAPPPPAATGDAGVAPAPAPRAATPCRGRRCGGNG